MIGYFPPLLPDELLYSSIARYHDLTRYTGRTLAEDLFDSGNVTAIVDLPCRLGALAANLHSPIITPDELIDRHTVLPFYAPALPAARHAAARIDMTGDGANAVHLRVGVMGERMPTLEWMNFCPACVKADYEAFGTPYWHRVHQLFGVLVCPIHEVFLRCSSARRNNRRDRHAYISAATAECVPVLPFHRVDKRNPDEALLLRIAQGAAWLLEHSSGPFDRARYLRALAQMGLAGENGRLRLKQLHAALLASYSQRILERLHCLPEHSGGWLAKLLRSGRSRQNPIRHLLLMDFLGHTPESFVTAKFNVPFGNSPWPCLNPICRAYEEARIKDCIVEGRSGLPVGVFRCPKCAFEYCRRGPDRIALDRDRYDWIRSYGCRWKIELQTLWARQRLSLRSIARRLGVDPLTVKRQAVQMDLPFPRRGKRPTIAKPALAKLEHAVVGTPLHFDRAEWSILLRTHPEFGTKNLRTIAPALYARLYRGDRMWLKQHCPARKHRSSRASVDWNARDVRIAPLVSGAAEQILARTAVPVRATVAQIAREVNALAWIEKHGDKMPITIRQLRHHAERRVDFALRRIRYATVQCEAQSECPPRWQFERLAGLRFHYGKTPEVSAAVDRAIDALAKSAHQPSPRTDHAA